MSDQKKLRYPALTALDLEQFVVDSFRQRDHFYAIVESVCAEILDYNVPRDHWNRSDIEALPDSPAKQKLLWAYDARSRNRAKEEAAFAEVTRLLDDYEGGKE